MSENNSSMNTQRRGRPMGGEDLLPVKSPRTSKVH